MPEDCFVSLWERIQGLISKHVFCCNAEIAEQYTHIVGPVGKCLVDHTPNMIYEVGVGSWDWNSYIAHVNRMTKQYHAFISDYHSNRQATIDLKDLSLVALAKTLTLPVVSMEGFDGGQISATKMRIPRLCINEGVDHCTFVDLLRKEGISI